MRKIVVGAFVSLDGVMQAPGGPKEDTAGGFTLGGWTFNYWDCAMGAFMSEGFSKPFDLLLGRKTYDIFAAHWPRVSDDDPIAAAFNKVTKYVATRSPEKPLAWKNSRTLGKDPVASLRDIKQQEGPDLLVQGSGDFIQTLLANDMVDEFNLLIFPLLLGPGKRLFSTGAMPAGLKLASSATSSTGVIMARYERGGEIVPGSFALED